MIYGSGLRFSDKFTILVNHINYFRKIEHNRKNSTCESQGAIFYEYDEKHPHF